MVEQSNHTPHADSDVSQSVDLNDTVRWLPLGKCGNVRKGTDAVPTTDSEFASKNNSPDTCAFALTEVGAIRENNEDQFLIADLSSSPPVVLSSIDGVTGNLLACTSDACENPIAGAVRSPCSGRLVVMAVADGVGGEPAGELASQIVIEEVWRLISTNAESLLLLHRQNPEQLLKRLKNCLKECEIAIVNDADVHPERRGMKTTLTLAVVLESTLYIAHAGDSRCYVFQNGELNQITRDHTLAEAYLASGARLEDVARYQNVLINSLGNVLKHLEVETYTADLQSGDQVLLCTDGISDRLRPSEIVEIITDNKPVPDRCAQLIDAAVAADSHDNLTVGLYQFD